MQLRLVGARRARLGLVFSLRHQRQRLRRGRGEQLVQRCSQLLRRGGSPLRRAQHVVVGAQLGATWTTKDDGVRHHVHALGSLPERADRVGELLRLDPPSRSHAPPRERLARTRLGSHHLGRVHKGRCQQAPHTLLSRRPLGDDVGVLDEVEVEVSEAGDVVVRGGRGGVHLVPPAAAAGGGCGGSGGGAGAATAQRRRRRRRGAGRRARRRRAALCGGLRRCSVARLLERRPQRARRCAGHTPGMRLLVDGGHVAPRGRRQPGVRPAAPLVVRVLVLLHVRIEGGGRQGCAGLREEAVQQAAALSTAAFEAGRMHELARERLV